MSRTTVTLDEDVEAAIRNRARHANVSFKQILNELIRKGLASTETAKKKSFKIPTFNCGVRIGIDQEKFNSLNDSLEADLL